ncbi:MAG: site-specific DNA-methyltransferase [Dehalococcoidia bacterium]|nr:site-specific DNA-methyltransferase [Dehalococcoidia bacterium]
MTVADNGVELVWEGKRREVERVALPFQRVEIINESRATRQAAPLFAAGAADGAGEGDGWRNKLIWGDNKYVLASLIEGDLSIGLEPLAGKVDLIYIDPPFAIGADFSFEIEIGDAEINKQQTIIEELAYRDTWKDGMGSYLQMMLDRLVLLKQILAQEGSIFVHVGYQASSHVRLVLDEVFGYDNLVDEIVWHYETSSGAPKYSLIKNHATIFHYSKSGRWKFNKVKEPWPEATLKKWQRDRRRPDLSRAEQVWQAQLHRPGWKDDR